MGVGVTLLDEVAAVLLVGVEISRNRAELLKQRGPFGESNAPRVWALNVVVASVELDLGELFDRGLNRDAGLRVAFGEAFGAGSV